MFILNNGIDSFFTAISSHIIHYGKKRKGKKKGKKKGKQEKRKRKKNAIKRKVKIIK